jgi:uncharacterized membrane-anchored protein
VTLHSRGVRRLPSILLAILVPAGCGGDDQRTDSLTREDVEESRAILDPALVAQLDSGNAAIRDGRHEAAGAHYRRGVNIDETSAAAWFGVYMSERALGNEQAAMEALERARSLAPRASLIEEAGPDGEPPP